MISAALILAVFVALSASLVVMREARQKHVGIWLGAYLGRRRDRAIAFNQAREEGPIHVDCEGGRAVVPLKTIKA